MFWNQNFEPVSSSYFNNTHFWVILYIDWKQQIFDCHLGLKHSTKVKLVINRKVAVRDLWKNIQHENVKIMITNAYHNNDVKGHLIATEELLVAECLGQKSEPVINIYVLWVSEEKKKEW